jgi:hypothetical protein
MASFTAPSASSKMKLGKVNRPKRTSPTGHGMNPKPEYPITDSFASKTIPKNRRDAMCRRKSFAQR